MHSHLHLLAHAPTEAQRYLRFPADEGIEPLATGTTSSITARLGSIDMAWSGPERRASDTAFALGVDATPSDTLRAWDLGTWTGRSVAHVAEREPAAFGAWRTDPAMAPEDGESLHDLLGRLASWLEGTAQLEPHTLVIADPAVIRAAVTVALEAGPASFWHFDIEPLSSTVLRHAHGQWRLRALGVDLRA
jgi:broad specificity phosphatase PhoE